MKSMRLFPRRHIFGISALLTIMLLILDNNFLISDALYSSLFPKPPETLTPASDLFYFQNLPSWGSVSIDGRRVLRLPTLADDPIQLAAGIHQIVWQAEPFQPINCQLAIAVPVTQTPACLTQQLTHPNIFTNSALFVTPSQPFSLHSLPAGQQKKLLTALQNKLNTLQSVTSAQPTEYLLTAQQQIHQTDQPLWVTMRVLLETNTDQPAQCQGLSLGSASDPPCAIAGRDCRLFCTIPWSHTLTSFEQPYWDVAVTVRIQYIYQTEREQATMWSTEKWLLMTLRISWMQGNWLISFHPQGESFLDDPNCSETVNIILTDPHYARQANSYWEYVSGSNRAQGCVATIRSKDLSRQTSQPILLQRFGILLTVNDTAGQLWPQLPRATTTERQMAQEILRHPAFVS